MRPGVMGGGVADDDRVATSKAGRALLNRLGESWERVLGYSPLPMLGLMVIKERGGPGAFSKFPALWRW